MKILILTDHKTHSSTNSFYLIANSLYQHKGINEVHVATRSNSSNMTFFTGESVVLYTKQLKHNINYDDFDKWINKGCEARKTLHHFDYLLLRLPRPIHSHFFNFLGQCFNERNIINRPSGIVTTGSKAFLLNLQDFTPPIKLLTNISEIDSFRKRFPIVLKPLEEYGGRGIVKIENDMAYLGNDEKVSFLEYSKIYDQNPQQFLGMKFLKNVSNGDKRIVVANNEVLAASLRLPAENSWLCNVAQGGSATISQISSDEKSMIEHLDPIMKNYGIFMYGLDTLENDNGIRIISEINTLSVGGIAPYAEMSGRNLGSDYADLFIDFVKRKK